MSIPGDTPSGASSTCLSAIRSAGRHRPRRLMHPGVAAATAAVALLACGCGSGTSPTATIAPGSPWLGAFAAVALPVPVHSLQAVDCVDASRCWAVGSTVGVGGAPNVAAVITTTTGGAAWSSQAIPTAVGYLSGIACSDRRHCTAVGQASQSSNGLGAIITTSDGGAAWTQQSVPAGISDVTAVSCLADGRCTALGTVPGGVAALVSSGSSSPWLQEGTLPAAVSGATSISCTDVQHCWVAARTTVDLSHVAGAVDVTLDGGATWRALPVPVGIGNLDGVSCLDGSATYTSPTQGTGTSTTGGNATPLGVPGVACAVVGTTDTTLNGTRTGHGIVLTTSSGGAEWSSQPVTPIAASLTGVSCTAPGSCVAVGSTVATSAQAGLVMLSGPNGATWRQAAVVGAPQPLTAVNCVSSSRCVVVGESISEHLDGG